MWVCHDIWPLYQQLAVVVGTADVEDVPFMFNSSLRVHLIDTPGFDDTHRPVVEILPDITHWLARSFELGVKLSVIVFLRKIGDTRLPGLPGRNLMMLRNYAVKVPPHL